MRQVCFNERQEVVVAEIPAPTVSPGHALVRTAYSVISSGTELAATSSTAPPPMVRRQITLARKLAQSLVTTGVRSTLERIQQRRHPAPVLQRSGYAASGEVIAVGEGIDDIRVGDLVACGGAGANHAEIISVPRNLIVAVPTTVDLREACFTTLGAIAMQGVRRAGVTFGESVVVVGLGIVGQLVSQLLNVAGCRVIAIDLVEQRLQLAREHGAQHVINGTADNVVAAVYQITGDHGADAVIVCAATKSDALVNQAFQMCRERGRVIIVGDVGLALERAHFYERELDLMISRSYGPGRYDREYEELGLDYPIGYVRWTENRNMQEFVRLLADGKVTVAPLISAAYELGEATEAYRALADRERNLLGVVFSYTTQKDASPTVFLKRAISTDREKVRCALIGAGSFARAYHLPNMRRIADCELRAVVSTRGANARVIAEEFGASYCATDYREVLQDAEIDAVLIATRHHLHAEIAIAAAQSGKHIFVEKPLALTVADCRRVSQAVADAGVLLTVGFNRRFAPLLREMKELSDQLSGPKIINYRVNAAYLPPDHWLIDPAEGGGRIVGEACHFFDLMYYLVGAEPVRVSAFQATSTAPAKDTANLIVNISFADGSVGTLLYTSLGHSDLEKERLEVFAGGKALVLNDFASLETYGVMRRQPAATGAPDKGHFQLLDHFCKAVRGNETLSITAEDGVRATLCAVAALDSVRTSRVIELDPARNELSAEVERASAAR